MASVKSSAKYSSSCETAELITDCIAEFHNLKEMRAALRTLPFLEIPDRLLPDTHPGEQLSAYLDGQLDTTEHDFVISHIDFCTDCRLELHELDSARTAIRSLPGLEAPEFLAVHRERVERERFTRRRVVAAGVGIAAAAALVFTAFGPSTEIGELDLDPLFDQHQARVSVESGFNSVPVFAPTGAQP